mmetsp:Transcript_24642/g.62556  ORF Transcript_24642/g.62556 Transcript_24642/m.62556 type:complete len:109 (+) Transcript_24642:624-950(+)
MRIHGLKTVFFAFGHLNLKFESDALPVSARGLLAQLSGTRALTKHNKNKFDLVVRKLQDRTDAAAEQPAGNDEQAAHLDEAEQPAQPAVKPASGNGQVSQVSHIDDRA